MLIKKKTAKKGFTIVELVIVIGVIGILTGILIPTFMGVSAKAEEAAAKSEVASAYSAYIADAMDEVIDKDIAASVIGDGYDSSKTYTIEIVKQENAVLTRKGVKYTYDTTNGWTANNSVNSTTIAKEGNNAVNVIYNNVTIEKRA